MAVFLNLHYGQLSLGHQNDNCYRVLIAGQTNTHVGVRPIH